MLDATPLGLGEPIDGAAQVHFGLLELVLHGEGDAEVVHRRVRVRVLRPQGGHASGQRLAMEGFGVLESLQAIEDDTEVVH